MVIFLLCLTFALNIFASPPKSESDWFKLPAQELCKNMKNEACVGGGADGEQTYFFIEKGKTYPKKRPFAADYFASYGFRPLFSKGKDCGDFFYVSSGLEKNRKVTCSDFVSEVQQKQRRCNCLNIVPYSVSP